MSAMAMWARALQQSQQAAHLTLPGLVDQLAASYGDQPALIGETETVSYRGLADRMNGYAAWASPLAGQTVALLMHNSPDYVAMWLGLTRVGCTVALLNTSLRPEALTHCISVAGAQWLLGDELVAEVPDHVASKLSWPALTAGVAPVAAPLPHPQAVALLIYTSGTTGLPKAARVTHRRITEWSFWFAGMTNATAEDRLYNCLPMYHSVGGVVAVGSMLVGGGSVVIRRRFSVSRFWRDVCNTHSTIFQYIGELCRYLTLAPDDPFERRHHLRLAVGNGLQAGIWENFRQRFAIPQILEYYAATEGVLSLYNCEGKPGSVGRIPPPLAAHFAVQLLRIDPETGEPLRNAAGFCQVSAIDEAGEAISLLKPQRPFDGYDDAGASQRKVLTDVFVAGDRWYRSGDLMRRDAAGFFYFLDRLGDTFRWKGENVSTTEVAHVIRCCPGVLDAIVYGVEMPGQEGRAGMAAITTANDFAITQLAAHLQQCLPEYARPIFVRCCDALDVTGTFKLTKKRFTDEGYQRTTDPIWVARDGTFMSYTT